MIRGIFTGFLVLLLLASSCTSTQSTLQQRDSFKEHPKNVILLIGDGMGLSQISAALYTNRGQMNMERFPVVGFHKPYADSDLITDSAAGATAFACGIKTYNSAIGMARDSIPCVNILEQAKANGLATGLVATATIVHATPAAFIAHQKMRVMYEAIAADMVESKVDLLIGGGKKYFDRRDRDDRDLVAEFRSQGYFVTDYSVADLYQTAFDASKPFIYFVADKHPLPVSAGRDYLAYASRRSAQFLKDRSKAGFFLMIEGSQIDWACHGNDANLAVKETLDFDRAIGEILDFAEKDGETLVIVTADHETGGLSINPGSKPGKLSTKFTTNGHTGSLVPVFAYGPGAERFSGIYENTAIYHKMYNALQLQANTDTGATAQIGSKR